MEVLVVLAVVFAVAVAAAGFLLVRRRPREAPRPAPDRPEPAAEPPSRPAPEGLAGRIRSLFRREGGDPWADLEDLLLRADVGPSTSARIVADVREGYRAGDDPVELVRAELRSILGRSVPISLPPDGVGVVLVVGVNGSGKTTTIGKLAARFAREGRRVSIANSDTFRAAASEQLGVWAERAGARLVRQERGADPGAVAYDAVTAARARGSDVLIVDTAGRLHTKEPLMEELRKVERVVGKALGRPPDETLLVLDATTGQNGIAQARAFTEAVGVTGVALTKLDGTAKGGIVLSVTEQLGVPVKVVGTGEGLEDLQPFDDEAFARRLLDG